MNLRLAFKCIALLMCIKQSQTRYLLLEISEEKQDIKCCSTPRPMCKEHCQCCSDGEWHSGPMGLGNCEEIELDNSTPCHYEDLNTYRQFDTYVPGGAVLHCCIEDEPEDERIITCKGVCECLIETTRNNNTEMVACQNTSFDAMECIRKECIKKDGNGRMLGGLGGALTNPQFWGAIGTGAQSIGQIMAIMQGGNKG